MQRGFFVEYAYDSGRVDYHERLCNELSRGERSPEELSEIMQDPTADPAFYGKLFDMISDSRKRIYFEHSPLGLIEAIQNTAPIVVNGTIDEKLETYENRLRERAHREKRRDESFASQLAGHCEENSTAKVLAMRGAMHQRALGKFLSADEIQFESHLSHSPMCMHTEEEIISKLEIGEATNRRELLLAITEQPELVRRGYDPKTLKIGELAEVQRELRSLSEEDLRTRCLAGGP